MKEEKSAFLIIEENTGLITSNPHLNQRFVKEEIFKEDVLQEIGIQLKNDKIRSKHTVEEVAIILSDISKKVLEKEISTRNNRGKIIDVLDSNSKKIIRRNKDHEYYHIIDNSALSNLSKPKPERVTRRSIKKESEIFGGKLILKSGDVNSLYRDIDDLYSFYMNNKGKLSSSFPSLIRMSLRLLCESASKDCRFADIAMYISKHFANAKKNLNSDIKTTLASQNVTETSMVQLLHTGAHNYQSANNTAQTIALSIILGEILKLSHGK